jgi:hypothetical protein
MKPFAYRDINIGDRVFGRVILFVVLATVGEVDDNDLD